MKKIIFFLLLFIPFTAFGLDFNLDKSKTDITLELAIKDTDGNDLGLPLKVIWKNEEKDKTYAIVNFLDNNFVSITKKIPTNDVNGYLYFDTSNAALQNKRKILDQRYSILVNYNFGGSVSSKSELFYVILEKRGTEYAIVDFYSQKEKSQKEEEIVESTEVVIEGEVTGSFYSKKDISIGLYNKRGEALYSTYTDREGKYQMNLVDFKDVLELDTTYYLIYGKTGDVEENEIGYLYNAQEYTFKSYISIVEMFSKPINLKVSPNLKDQVITEPFPYIFVIIGFLIYGYFFHRYVMKKLIRKMFVHPLKKDYHIIYNKRKNLIENLMKNNIGKEY